MLFTHLMRATGAVVITVLSVLVDLRVMVTGITMAVLAVLEATHSFTAIDLHLKDVLNRWQWLSTEGIRSFECSGLFVYYLLCQRDYLSFYA